MPYGTIKIDTITFTDGGVDKSVPVSGLVQNPTFTGNITATGTISGNIIQGGTTVSGLTVTGTTANFASGVFTTQVSGVTVIATTGTFTSLTGITTTGTTANFASGVFTTQVSGVTVIATTGTFTSLTGTTTTGTTANFASGVFTTQVSGVTVIATTGTFTSLTGTTTTMTSGVFASGTEPLPSISFVSDPNTGIYSPGADQLAVATNGTEKLIVLSNGNVGIGTSSPSTNTEINAALDTGASLALNEGQLSIGREANSGGAVRIGYDTTNNFGFISSGRVGTSWDKLILNAGGGNVGIGVTSPGYALDVVGTGRFTATVSLLLNGTSGTAVTWQHNGTSVGDLGTGNQVLSGGSTGDAAFTSRAGALVFGINTAEKARLDTSGRLLVGTSTARSNINILNQTDLTPSVQFEGQSTSNRSTGLSIINYSASDYGSAFTLGASNSNTLGTNTLVESGADVGVINFVGADGTRFVSCASIVAKIDGTPGANDMPGRLEFSTTPDNQSPFTGPVERMRITNEGFIRFNTTGDPNSSSNLGAQIGYQGQNFWRSRNNGTLTYYHMAFYNDNGEVGSISTNASATAYNTSSDYRLKENVESITDGITRLQQLKPSRFNFIANPDKAFDGFIAHEAQAVVPECVTGTKDAVDDDGSPVYQGIDQSKLVPLLTAALQEAVAKIKTLEQRLTAAGID